MRSDVSTVKTKCTITHLRFGFGGGESPDAGAEDIAIAISRFQGNRKWCIGVRCCSCVVVVLSDCVGWRLTFLIYRHFYRPRETR